MSANSIRVVGHRWSPQSYEIKDFLARNQIPYQWLDLELQEEARRIQESLGAQQLPVVIFPDGSFLEAPDLPQLAEKIGLQQDASHSLYRMVGGDCRTGFTRLCGGWT
ncbi:MAG: hypothetical protein M3Z24_03460 [Chloroflexota bacterium]|nr:hypothetical protein [Chloroflexota bacterium]